MIYRIDYGTYCVEMPKIVTWSLYQHIRQTIKELSLRHGERFIIVIYDERENIDMPDYYEKPDFDGMFRLRDMVDVTYNHAIFANTPRWRQLVYKAVSLFIPQFGEKVYFENSAIEAIILAENIRKEYPSWYFEENNQEEAS